MFGCTHIKSPYKPEVEWVYGLILLALDKNKFEIPIEPPLLEDCKHYNDFLEKNEVTFYERLLLALAHCFQLTPKIFEVLKHEESQLNTIDAFGVIPNSTTNFLLPTIRTANWIYSVCFNKNFFIGEEHYFFKDNILGSPSFETSIFNTPLVFTKKSQYQFYGEQELFIEYSNEFPAQLLTTKLDKQDLILPKMNLKDVDELIFRIQHRKVFEEDEQLNKWIRPGYRALFYGPPGTGKTMTASLIGKETQMPVYKIDISSMVSKYIGETQKNLEKVFLKAEAHDWILFFDECDALLGTRSSTGNVNERGGNQEVAYLLQRLESYRGVVLLATNLKDNIDEAFMRRFESSIKFETPDIETRKRLWNTIFSGKHILPTEWVNTIAANYDLTGGQIVNVLQFIALYQQQCNEKMSLEIVLEGIRREYRKKGKAVPTMNGIRIN